VAKTQRSMFPFGGTIAGENARADAFWYSPRCAPAAVGFHGLLGGIPMVRLSRPGVWTSVLVGCLLVAVAASAGTLVASKHRESDGWRDGFLAYGQVSVAISRNDVNTPRTKRCIAYSVQAGIDVRQGVPVVITLDGRAVGGGDLSTGELIPETTRHGSSEPWPASCHYKFSAPVTESGEGQYTVDIGDAKVASSMDDLRNGVDLRLS
jgi:hypothetical protein